MPQTLGWARKWSVHQPTKPQAPKTPLSNQCPEVGLLIAEETGGENWLVPLNFQLLPASFPAVFCEVHSGKQLLKWCQIQVPKAVSVVDSP